ncbi:MAG: hypothetical protein JF623_05200, partial [Acidobacteria bacterium]|nr:hypothetical protein [Acidobacteriota bacterium]
MPVFRSLRRKARLGRGDVLFASGLTGVSMRYRCRNQCEALAHAGLDCDVVLERETDLDAALGRYRCVVLHHVAWTPKVERFVARARRHGTPVLFDVDDLVFEPAAAWLPTDRLDAAARRHFDAEVAALRSTLAASDGVLVSTEPL